MKKPVLFALAVALAPLSAQAGGGVSISVSTPEFGFRIGAPFFHGAPVFVPAPVVVAAPVYAPAPVFMPPPPVFVPAPDYDYDDHGERPARYRVPPGQARHGMLVAKGKARYD